MIATIAEKKKLQRSYETTRFHTIAELFLAFFISDRSDHSDRST